MSHDESQTPSDMTGPELKPTNLNMHLYDGFPNQSGTKEGPEGNQEMTTSYSGQVK